jgi:hypothetical protein
MRTSMATTTTTNIHLFQLGWRPLYTTNHTNVEPMQNTAKRRLSLACPPNTIGVENSGQLQPELLKSWALHFSSTNTCLTNPPVTPVDLVIAAAENHAQALEISIPQHLQVSTIQALKDLSEVFTDASHKYSNDPAIHMPNTPPSHPHREPMESPRVSPTPLGSPPPRVHTTMISLTAPSTLPTCAPSSIQKSLFPPDVSSVGSRQNIAKQQLGAAPRLPTNSNIRH